MSDHAVFFAVLGVCVCGVVVAVAVLEWAVWRIERDDGRWR